MTTKTLRPGPGWKRLSLPVYEHSSRVRIHLLGYAMLPNGQYLSATRWPDSREAHRMILINGGNRKRGLMAWALAAYYKLENNNEHHKDSYFRD